MPRRCDAQQATKTIVIASLTAALLLASAAMAPAASHSDAPLIKQDPQANITDVYAFVGTKYNDSNAKVLNVLVQTRPFSEPGDGAIYERFADDAQYSIHITHPATGETVMRYDFTFSDVNPASGPGLKNGDTILSYGLGTEVGPIQTIGDARQNFTQTYTVKRDGTQLGTGLLTPPPNVGPRTTPAYNDASSGLAISGATNLAELDSYTRQAIHELPGGEAVFAGPREDGFYSDIPAIFDLLDGRILDNNGDANDGLGQDGGGVDGFKGFNVLCYAIQIPIDKLQQVPGFPTVGVYASVGRQRIRLLRSNGDAVNAGPFVQVNRMGNPLFNEALVALKDKDNYNRTSPVDDATNFQIYALSPNLIVLLNTVFGTAFPETERADLAGIFIPDVLRVNTSTAPVSLPGQSNFNRLSVFGGDLTDGIPSGWPNGRRIGDDVIDIALTAIATGTVVGDNVGANDQVFNQVFPYLGTPHAGPNVNQRQAP